MKAIEILKHTYEVRNNFEDWACINSIKSIISDKVFKELINGEKAGLTIELRIFVNEETP